MPAHPRTALVTVPVLSGYEIASYVVYFVVANGSPGIAILFGLIPYKPHLPKRSNNYESDKSVKS